MRRALWYAAGLMCGILFGWWLRAPIELEWESDKS